MTREEAIAYYNVWPYKYKPTLELYLKTISDCSLDSWEMAEQIEHLRAEAYYSQNQTTANFAFNKLACVLYFVLITGIETVYDHVLKSNNDFEWKLNNLHKKKYIKVWKVGSNWGYHAYIDLVERKVVMTDYDSPHEGGVLEEIHKRGQECSLERIKSEDSKLYERIMEIKADPRKATKMYLNKWNTEQSSFVDGPGLQQEYIPAISERYGGFEPYEIDWPIHQYLKDKIATKPDEYFWTEERNKWDFIDFEYQ